MSIAENLHHIQSQIPENVSLVAVSKTRPVDELMQAYEAGQRVFGENKIQEMVTKWEHMPKDVQWHMIGHVQTNKVKYMAGFVALIHAVDSLKLLQEINKQAEKNQRTISCLLQIKIAKEDSKYGLNENEALDLLQHPLLNTLKNVRIVGLMGMATFTKNERQLDEEFGRLQKFYNNYKTLFNFDILSMGMSGDYPIALKHESNMIRVGSAIFGQRKYD
ncbi:MAG TPA: YggS family pyridoxal phosphate-dependent enzyme [Flavobacteriaceae bacterium]|nr:YggS family pyridoxal phosphate-dependent enzyme [Flavobacteriaceae bacterium]MCB9213708.1 YggS family pyridoxal phosphate-dependent enzyme [Alteromonas sp.]HPF11920.1 YggS family pyridoxal phosphate-dependent enzyme [Flavobacteriaceae bacterium]HQU21914.1 YggS family pyridoxal phosphate-dependent enzyme [Flavobacteriaceae bacterium]HQU65448.1 YggS family pyridoxal phosphate-dependent enzyme [Flavobacteriaceae bacterium]